MPSKIKQYVLKDHSDTRTSLVEMNLWDSRKYCKGILPAVPEVNKSKKKCAITVIVPL